ncbi:MAG TPA: 50S ribosomal protein L11 methyltransferase [Streptosporangiaceae bacterium]|nr:50S ribosomal protein L11 methyltransferase [Streptosporangiaceae bacterium]
MASDVGAPPEPSLLKIILTSTELSSVPLVPEIQIYQASEPISLWEDTERAKGVTGLDPPFWAFAWAGGRALARYLLDHPAVVRGRRVIDIASGSGLVAIAAAKAGAADVTAYDIDPLAAAAVTVNARANKVAVASVCADLLGDDGPRATAGDLVLVADAFYERELADKVMSFLERAHQCGAAALAGDFGRTYLPRDRLVSLATYDVPGLLVLEGTDIKRTTIWTLRAAPAHRTRGHRDRP